MSIKKRAAIETAKTLAAFTAGGFVVYFLLGFLGPKLGMFFLLASMSGWFTWLAYDFYVHKFTWEERLKD